jgi:hypothetical protein
VVTWNGSSIGNMNSYAQQCRDCPTNVGCARSLCLKKWSSYKRLHFPPPCIGLFLGHCGVECAWGKASYSHVPNATTSSVSRYIKPDLPPPPCCTVPASPPAVPHPVLQLEHLPQFPAVPPPPPAPDQAPPPAPQGQLPPPRNPGGLREALRGRVQLAQVWPEAGQGVPVPAQLLQVHAPGV